MRALLVYKKSMLQLYALERKSQRVEELLRRNDPSVQAMASAHEVHGAAIQATGDALRRAGYKVQRTYRARLGQLIGFDLVVTVGGDGTLLDVSHHLRTEIPVLGVNSAPAHSVGMLSGASVATLDAALEDIRSGALRPVEVARLGLWLDGKALPVLALNDVLIAHRNPAATTRYHLSVGEHTESQTGSGLWVATAVGSTAAMRSAGGEVRPLDDELMQFRVREPFGLRGPMLLTAGLLGARQPLRIHSTVREGYLYVDGPHVRYPFGLGAQLELRVIPRSLPLILSTASLERRCLLARPD